MPTTRKSSFVIVAAAYVLALAVGAGVFLLLRNTAPLWRLFAADGAATIFIWLISLLVRNASVYDPYWSVAPPILLAGLMVYAGRPGLTALPLLGLLLIWGLRLTTNWARGFRGLQVQDWRYTDFERKYPRLWPLINLTGIQLMPTAVVFLATLPSLHVALKPAALHFLTVPALLFTAASICLEAAADAQLRRFRADPENAGQVNTRGLWRWSRHPNYLGEILFWWGLALTAFSMARLPLALLAGPATVTALFLLVSIPMMEKRQRAEKPDYRAYQRTTGTLLPRLDKRRPDVLT